ncbi:hypothetical protein QBC47DRAFT_418475 [Echria macrotheca]|uniref:Uncharacterized protein n=1 Tax=Echria macrotheca TaxID=438768 RepID=A0AAJ0B3M8_9PEZI|nr:hypothetical protein QBC47DRAFT_418475 [Echria macrotheca]
MKPSSVIAALSPALLAEAQLIRLFTTSTNTDVNNTYVSSNGTHLGIRSGGLASSAIQASTSPGSKTNTNIIAVSGDGNVLGLLGPSGNLAFVGVSNPPASTPPGAVLEWDLWRLFAAPDSRVRMADMTASNWVATQAADGAWLLTWFKGEGTDGFQGNIDPGMTTVTLFWEPVPL